MAQITGFPVQVLRSVVGQAMQRASSGQTSGLGWSRHIDQAGMPIGMAHQKIAGTTTNGTNSHSPTGGYRMSPASIVYGPVSWWGSKYGPPASHRAATSR